MAAAVEVEVLRVFTDHNGGFGNPLGVVLDGALVADRAERQALAARLGYSETVFIDDAASGALEIYTPVTDLHFAGHPAVGTAWLLSRELGFPPPTLRTPGATIDTWTEGEEVWVRGPLALTPPWWHERLLTAEEVASLAGPLSPEQDATQVWAWEDEAAGLVRARVFARRYGIAQDEACGSASMRLAAALGRALTIRHGEGSVVRARPGMPGTAEVGGRVVSDGFLTASH